MKSLPLPLPLPLPLRRRNVFKKSRARYPRARRSELTHGRASRLDHPSAFVCRKLPIRRPIAPFISA